MATYEELLAAGATEHHDEPVSKTLSLADLQKMGATPHEDAHPVELSVKAPTILSRTDEAPAPAAPPVRPAMSKAQTALIGGRDGATFGLADRIGADFQGNLQVLSDLMPGNKYPRSEHPVRDALVHPAIQRLLGMQQGPTAAEQTEAEALRNNYEDTDKSKHDNPGSHALTSILGSFANPVSLAGGEVLPAVRAATTLGKAAKIAAPAAAFSFLGGAGHSRADDLADIANDGARAIPLGLATGGAASRFPIATPIAQSAYAGVNAFTHPDMPAEEKWESIAGPLASVGHQAFKKVQTSVGSAANRARDEVAAQAAEEAGRERGGLVKKADTLAKDHEQQVGAVRKRIATELVSQKRAEAQEDKNVLAAFAKRAQNRARQSDSEAPPASPAAENMHGFDVPSFSPEELRAAGLDPSKVSPEALRRAAAMYAQKAQEAQGGLRSHQDLGIGLSEKAEAGRGNLLDVYGPKVVRNLEDFADPSALRLKMLQKALEQDRVARPADTRSDAQKLQEMGERSPAHKALVDKLLKDEELTKIGTPDADTLRTEQLDGNLGRKKASWATAAKRVGEDPKNYPYRPTPAEAQRLMDLRNADVDKRIARRAAAAEEKAEYVKKLTPEDLARLAETTNPGSDFRAQKAASRPDPDDVLTPPETDRIRAMKDNTSWGNLPLGPEQTPETGSIPSFGKALKQTGLAALKGAVGSYGAAGAVVGGIPGALKGAGFGAAKAAVKQDPAARAALLAPLEAILAANPHAGSKYRALLDAAGQAGTDAAAVRLYMLLKHDPEIKKGQGGRQE